METQTKPFGVWLAEELGQRDITQRRFAKEIEVTGVTVGKWIAGKTHPEWWRIPQIAKALGIHEQVVIDAFRAVQPPPFDDITLARMLDLPNDLRHLEVILLKHIFRAIRAAEDEYEASGRLEIQQS